MSEAEPTPEMVESRNGALRVLRDWVNELGPLNAETCPTGRSRRTQLMLVVERLCVDVRENDAGSVWMYVVGPTVVGSPADPMDAAVRLLHLVATGHPDSAGTGSTTQFDRSTVSTETVDGAGWRGAS